MDGNWYGLWATAKAGGAAIVVASCVGWGWGRVRELARRPKTLAAAMAALEMLETEVFYALNPLPDALLSAAERLGPTAGSPVGQFLTRCSALMRPAVPDGRLEPEPVRGPGLPAAEAWRQALDEVAPRLGLKRSDFDALLRLGAVLGASDRDDQVRHLRLAREELSHNFKQAVADRDAKTRVYLYLGLGAGLTVVILLW